MSTNIDFDPHDGSPLVPTNPAVAKSRLAELDADPNVVEALMNPRHPMHSLRSQERKGLFIVASRAQPQS